MSAPTSSTLGVQPHLRESKVKETADESDNQPTQPTSSCAAELGVKPQTLHKAYCKHGHYFGVKPVSKLPNGRLRWPLHPLRLLKKGVSE